MTHRMPQYRPVATWLLLTLLLIPAGLLVHAQGELDTFASRSGWQVSHPSPAIRPVQISEWASVDDVVDDLHDRVVLPAATVVERSLLDTRSAVLSSVPPGNFDRVIRFLHLTI